MKTEEFLKTAAATPGVTGNEGAVAAFIAEAFRPFVDEVTITPDAAAKVKNVGDSAEEKNTFTWSVENEAGYTIAEDEYGDLEITPVTVTLTSGNAEKE